MCNLLIKSQVQEVQIFLEEEVDRIEGYLNATTITSLLLEKQGDRAYFEGLLSNLRRLLVFCEEGLDKCIIVLQSEPFMKNLAEKTLYKIYHQCIEEFFSPRYDLWFEDSRAAYLESNSIRFRQEPPKSFAHLINQVEIEFRSMREELEYYETDYKRKTLLSKGS
ncbi:DUF3907 family protein [Rossellomorea aquimaris]|uniref:DUF3907 family protein n=1 Tax=Rossellomorea aquimaris TaxID=189382 RepID=UPI0007D06BF7|nr:DUF3907 family protein [Rossellomorea aquimaris]